MVSDSYLRLSRGATPQRELNWFVCLHLFGSGELGRHRSRTVLAKNDNKNKPLIVSCVQFWLFHMFRPSQMKTFNRFNEFCVFIWFFIWGRYWVYMAPTVSHSLLLATNGDNRNEAGASSGGLHLLKLSMVKTVSWEQGRASGTHLCSFWVVVNWTLGW